MCNILVKEGSAEASLFSRGAGEAAKGGGGALSPSLTSHCVVAAGGSSVPRRLMRTMGSRLKCEEIFLLKI
jgi:hypothetical protein